MCDLPQEKKDEMKTDALIEQHHEKMMVEDEEYFCQWTTEHFDLKDCVDFLDVIGILNKHLSEYGWGLDDLVEYWKEI